jgi:hypothetical protein
VLAPAVLVFTTRVGAKHAARSRQFFSQGMLVALGTRTGRNLLQLGNKLQLEHNESYVSPIYTGAWSSTRATIEGLLETAFSVRSMPRCYNRDNFRSQSVESRVTLRVVGGDENGSLKSETVKDGHKSQGTRTRERLRWRGPAAYIKADPSSRQRGRSTKTRR